MATIPVGITVVELGTVFATEKAVSRLNQDDAMGCLARHMIGDYGDIDAADWRGNDAACAFGFRVVSSYSDRQRNRFLIVTESDRSATTILLLEEY